MNIENTLKVFALMVLCFSCKQQVTSNKSVDPISISKTDISPQKSKSWVFTSIIRSILHDSKGNFWFGSDKQGVCKYNGETFTYFTIDEGLSNNQIRTIQEDTQGHIWFATGNGVCTYDGDTIVQQSAIKNFLPQTTLTSNWQNTPNDLWFNGEVEGGIYRYDGKHLNLLNFPILHLNNESSHLGGTVTGISEGINNMLWISNYNGILGYNGEEFIDINEKDISYHVRNILEDSKGRLWIANNGIGVLMYDGKTTHYLSDLLGQDKFPKFTDTIYPYPVPMHVFGLAEDKHGHIWFGDRDTGAWKYDGTTLKNYTQKDGLPNNFVWHIYQDNNQELWFGLSDGDVCRFDGKRFKTVFK